MKLWKSVLVVPFIFVVLCGAWPQSQPQTPPQTPTPPPPPPPPPRPPPRRPPRHTRNHRLAQRGEGVVPLSRRDSAVCQPGHGSADRAQGEEQADQARRGAVLHREEHEGRQGREAIGAVVGGPEEIRLDPTQLRPLQVSGDDAARAGGGILRRQNENREFAELGGRGTAEASAGARTDARPPGPVFWHREMDEGIDGRR